VEAIVCHCIKVLLCRLGLFALFFQLLFTVGHVAPAAILLPQKQVTQQV
jgi:hypothetical protein